MAGISLQVDEHIARLTLNRPNVLNALSPDVLTELVALCRELNENESVRVVILDGAGQHFSAGADLPEFSKRLDSAPDATADLGRQATEALASIPQISIAAIKGYCVGGGVVLSAMCDMRIAADDARFSIPELDAGIPLSWGAKPHVVRLFGEAVANDLVLTCRPFGADDALGYGFLSRVIPVDEFDSVVDEIAEGIASKPALVLRQTKRKLKDIRAGRFEPRDDARDMLDAIADEEASAVRDRYVRKNIGD